MWIICIVFHDHYNSGHKIARSEIWVSSINKYYVSDLSFFLVTVSVVLYVVLSTISNRPVYKAV